MPSATTFDATRLLASLNRYGVKYVVIGGVAAAAGGVFWTTFDLDIIVEVSEENLSALAKVLDDLAAEYDTPHSPPIRPDMRRLRTLGGPQLFRTRYGRLDVLKEAGGATFQSLLSDAHAVQLEGMEARYASLSALLRMKRAANRPKDRQGIELIEAALAEREDKTPG